MTSSISSFRPLAAVLLFVASLPGAARVLEVVFDRPNFQTMAVGALGPSTEALVIGSSRVFFGIDPERFGGRLMNLAADYLDLSTALELWELHEPKVPGLKTLVLEFGLATLWYDTRRLEPYSCYHLGLSGLPPGRMFREDFDAAVHRLFSPFFKWRLTPLFWSIHRDAMESTLEPLAARAGYVPTEVRYGGEERVAKRRQEKTVEQLAAQDPEVPARNLADGRDLIATANARGLRVVLLRFPKSPEARTLYLPAWDGMVARAIAELREDPRRLRFEVVDLGRDDRFVTDDFRDPDHLNRHGAERLAAILGPLLFP